MLGHESARRGRDGAQGSGFAPGDLVVGIVRRPDPVPCPACAAGEWDMCRNGRYTERGIKDRHGFGAERFRIEPEFAVKVDPDLGALGVLLEPASIVAKAWDHTEGIGRRSRAWKPRTMLVTGAGSIGLLAALIGAQRGLEVHVLDHNDRGLKRQLVQGLGGQLHVGDISALNGFAPDILMECSGVPSVISDVLGRMRAGRNRLPARRNRARPQASRSTSASSTGLWCSTTMPCSARSMPIGCTTRWRSTRWRTPTRPGSTGLITRRVPLERWSEALERRPGDIKVVIDFAADGAPPLAAESASNEREPARVPERKPA